MKTWICLFMMVAGISASMAQDSLKLIGLHPAVGKVISLSEKKYYCLFPEYNDSSFVKAEIARENDSTYVLYITAINGTRVTKSLSRTEMDALWDKIDQKERASRVDKAYSSNEDQREERRRRSHEEWRRVGADVIANAFIITFEVLITLAFSK